MTNPEVSVIIPAHNAETYLGDALASVLAQQPEPASVLVIDDGSTDGTAQVAHRFGPPVACLHQEHTGAGAARNHGLRLARTDLVAFLDADDLWPFGSLALRVGALSRDQSFDAVLGHVEEFACPTLRGTRHTRGPRPGWLPSALVARRQLFDRVGPFSESYRAGEFIEWCLRARRHGMRAAMLPDTVLRRRVHAANTLQRDPAAAAEYLRIVRAHLAERRP